MAVSTRPQSKRGKSASGAKKSPARDAPPEKEKRREDGTFAKGTTGNPGGLSKEHRRLRALFLEDADEAHRVVRGWLKDKKSFQKQRAAVEIVLTRGLGKPAKASELPLMEDTPEPAESDCTTSNLLVQVRTMLARGVAGLQQRQASGELGADDIAELGNLGRTLGELLKAEREAERASKLTELPAEELVQLAFQVVPVDVLRAALSRREAQETEGGEKPANEEGAA